jgi:hypothetical protein
MMNSKVKANVHSIEPERNQKRPWVTPVLLETDYENTANGIFLVDDKTSFSKS